MSKGKRSGHFCRICKRCRPNEAFSGRGHATHLCKTCQRLPAEQREAIEQEDEIFGFLRQSTISPRNIARLRHLAHSASPRIAELAGVVLQVAAVKPAKKRRLGVLARERLDLLRRLEETGLIFAHHS